MRFCALLLCLFSLTAFASKKHPPLPEAVYQAKTVFIVNKTSYQSTSDGAFEALTKWGKLSVVSDKSTADLILTFNYADELVNGTTRWGDFTMTVNERGVDDPVFQATSAARGFHLASNRGALGAEDCIKQLEKRFDEQH